MNPSVDLGLQSLPLLDVLLLSIATLPIWLGMLILVSSGVLLTLIGAFIVGRATQAPSPTIPLVDHTGHFLLGAKFVFMGEVFAALLGFVLVDGGIRYAMGRQQVQVESSAMRMFDAGVADLSDPQAVELRRDLRTYAASVVENEYLTMQVGRESPAARKNFEQVLNRYLHMETRSQQDRLVRLQTDQFLSKMLDGRQKRLQSVRPGLRTLIWTVLLSNSLVVIVFSWLFRVRSLAAHIAMSVAMTIALMVVMHFAILLYHPFTGDLAVSSRPYQTLPQI